MQKRTISLASYSITLKDKSYSSKPLLENFNGTDALTVIEGLFNGWKNHAIPINTVGDCVKCVQLERQDRYLKGLVERGSTGTEQDIEDLDQKKVIHRMTKTQAVLNPYYFLFYVPKNQQKAILLLQRTGNTSPHAIADYLENYFKVNFDPYLLEIKYLLQREVLDAIVETPDIREVRLTQYEWSPDRADNIFGPTAKPLKVVISYRSKYNIPLTESVKNIISGKTKPNQLVEHGIEPDEVTVVAKVGKKKRTFTFAEEKDAKFRPYRDITTDIKYGENNHPTFESVDASAVEFMDELAKTMYEIPNS